MPFVFMPSTAILQEKDIAFEKIHDLDVLLQMVRSFIPALEKYRDDFIKLSAYAVDIRYPGLGYQQRKPGNV